MRRALQNGTALKLITIESTAVLVLCRRIDSERLPAPAGESPMRAERRVKDCKELSSIATSALEWEYLGSSPQLQLRLRVLADKCIYPVPLP
jgi:hypothetical protein